jgi:hypothetical protein
MPIPLCKYPESKSQYGKEEVANSVYPNGVSCIRFSEMDALIVSRVILPLFALFIGILKTIQISEQGPRNAGFDHL